MPHIELGMRITNSVRRGGLSVTLEQIAAARDAGATGRHNHLVALG